MKTHESEEMYLETILLLSRKQQAVHAIDIAGELGYAKSSVSRAVGLLVGKGYIALNESDEISLTSAGRERAEGVYDRHRVITSLLMKMGADRGLAEDNACRIEHVISPELFEIMKEYEQR